MMKWVSKNIKGELQNIPGVQTVEVYGPGGDYDTDNIIVKNSNGYSLWISGYQEDTSVEPTDSSDDREVFTVVVEDGKDSRGGCNTDEEEDARLFHAIRRHFTSKGAELANHYDEIF